MYTNFIKAIQLKRNRKKSFCDRINLIIAKSRYSFNFFLFLFYLFFIIFPGYNLFDFLLIFDLKLYLLNIRFSIRNLFIFSLPWKWWEFPFDSSGMIPDTIFKNKIGERQFLLVYQYRVRTFVSIGQRSIGPLTLGFYPEKMVY